METVEAAIAPRSTSRAEIFCSKRSARVFNRKTGGWGLAPMGTTAHAVQLAHAALAVLLNKHELPCVP